MKAAETLVDNDQVEGGLVHGVASDEPGVNVFKGIPYAGSTAERNHFGK